MSSADIFVTPSQGLVPKSVPLSPLDKQMFGGYLVKLILSFPLSSGSSPTQIFKSLQASLSKTIAALPFIAGHVVTTSLGQLTLDIKTESGVLLYQKDLTIPANRLPEVDSYQQWKDQNFPAEKVLEAAVSPVGGLPENPLDAPVLVAQCNFLKDGVLLCVAFHHTAFDSKASSAIVTRWAEERRLLVENGAESFSVMPLHATDRITPFIPISKEFDAGLLPDWTTDPLPPPLPNVGLLNPKVRTFHFSASKLAELKRLASSKSDGATWISTNDALSALLWHIAVRARNPDLLNSSQVNCHDGPERSLACAIDFREKMTPAIPQYFGNASCFLFTRLKQSHLLQAPVPESKGVLNGHEIPLTQTAQAIRRSVNKADHAHIRNVVSFVASTPSTTQLRQVAGDMPFLMNSIAELPVGCADWGPGLGRPEAVRMPTSPFIGDGTAAVFPKTGANGGLDVMLVMDKPVLERMTMELKGWGIWVE